MGSIIGGSNKFGLLRADGESCIINRKSGVTFENSWLSNTYAWSPSRFGFQSPQTARHGYYGSFRRADEDYEWPNYSHSNWQQKSIDWRDQQTAKAKGEVVTLGSAEDEVDDDFVIYPATASQVKKYIKACHNQYARRGTAGIEQWVSDAPEKAAKVLAYWYDDLDELELIDMVRKDPDEAAQWIQDLFTSDSVTPSWLG
jgi:hypothetical protein